MHRKILWMGYFLQVDCILPSSPLILFFSKQKKELVSFADNREKKGVLKTLEAKKNAVTRIRTWVFAATTQSTYHYTITALM